jgi:hypothetical protein
VFPGQKLLVTIGTLSSGERADTTFRIFREEQTVCQGIVRVRFIDSETGS